ncbi:MAG: helical backbone metal receptor [Lentisphaerales bacterium]|nr:helical backbone metal receptor [Lentisphaerales bacterium]
MKKFLLVLILLSIPAFAEKVPKRIISLAPSITEILCSLDLQKKIVGVTDFCKDPYKNTNFKGKSVGGLINPNFEKMIHLKPDVIFTLKGKADHTAQLRKYGLNVVVLQHQNLEGVFDSIKIVGEKCGNAAIANKLHKDLQSLLKEPKSDGRKVLVTISRLSSQANIRLWVAGNDGFYSKILNLCGVENAITGQDKFSQITPEALVRINPDEIIFLKNVFTEEEKAAELKAWQKFASLKAIKENRFHFIIGDEVLIPGPRFPALLEKFKKALHK